MGVKQFVRRKTKAELTPFGLWLYRNYPEIYHELNQKYREIEYNEADYNEKFFRFTADNYTCDESFALSYLTYTSAVAHRFASLEVPQGKVQLMTSYTASLHDNLPRVDTLRSPGYPYFLPQTTTKSDDFKANCEEIIAAVGNIHKGRHTLVVQVGWKREVIGRDKTLRTIAATGLPHMLAEMYFGWHSQQMQAKVAWALPIGLGFAPMYGNWQRLLAFLDRPKPYIAFTVDLKNQEFTFTRLRVEALIRARTALLRCKPGESRAEVEAAMRNTYAAAGPQALVAHTNGNLYRKGWQNLTGRYLTLADNTLDAFLGVSFAWYRALKGYRNFSDFPSFYEGFLCVYRGGIYAPTMRVDGDNVTFTVPEVPMEVVLRFINCAAETNHIVKLEHMEFDTLEGLQHCKLINASGTAVPEKPYKSLYNLLHTNLDLDLVDQTITNLHVQFYEHREFADLCSKYLYERKSQFATVHTPSDETLMHLHGRVALNESPPTSDAAQKQD